MISLSHDLLDCRLLYITQATFVILLMTARFYGLSVLFSAICYILNSEGSVDLKQRYALTICV